MMAFEILALISAAAVQQAVQQPVDQIVVTGEKPEDRKRVCKETEEIGSIIPKRVCRTKGEWASAEREKDRRTRAYNNDKAGMSSRVKRPGTLE
jgi:hypothetical protein